MAKRTRGILYRSYSFIDKDPVIDRVRTLVQREGLTRKQLELISGVKVSTLRGWFEGQTKRPQNATVTAVVHAMGYASRFVKVRQVNFERSAAVAAEEIAAARDKLKRAA